MIKICVTCAVILKGNKILVTQRSESMLLPLKWEFPGGKIEHNESEEECIYREIKEELNIEIEIIKKLRESIYDYDNYSIRLIPFLANFTSGEIRLSEHKSFLWLQKEELNNLDWAEADISIVAELYEI